MPKKFSAPKIGSTFFNCPNCGALCQQSWFTVCLAGCRTPPSPTSHVTVTELKELLSRSPERDRKKLEEKLSVAEEAARGHLFRAGSALFHPDTLQNLFMSQCHGCEQYTIWKRDSIIFPQERYPVEPNEDMPEEIKRDFEEARSIVQVSPRGAAALLRLCIQKLCSHVLGKQADINTAIGELVKQGLRVEIQQALDAVRVIGNESVHPGKIDLRDEPETAQSLFDLVNWIVEDRISQPRKALEIYNKLPASKIAGIKQRDQAAAGKVASKP